LFFRFCISFCLWSFFNSNKLFMNHYYYECFSCKSKFSKQQIENDLHYLCPKCGKAEKNKPLVGVLKIIYNYNSVSEEIKKSDFLNLTPGEFWLYPQLWPLEYSLNNHSVSIKGITEQQLNSIKTISSHQNKVPRQWSSGIWRYS